MGLHKLGPWISLVPLNSLVKAFPEAMAVAVGELSRGSGRIDFPDDDVETPAPSLSKNALFASKVGRAVSECTGAADIVGSSSETSEGRYPRKQARAGRRLLDEASGVRCHAPDRLPF